MSIDFYIPFVIFLTMCWLALFIVCVIDWSVNFTAYRKAHPGSPKPRQALRTSSRRLISVLVLGPIAAAGGPFTFAAVLLAGIGYVIYFALPDRDHDS